MISAVSRSLSVSSAAQQKSCRVSAAVPKAVVMRETEGLLKALTDPATGQLLGVTLLCPEAHEMINTAKVAMDFHADAAYLRDAIFTHPTMTEAFNELLA